LHGPIRATPSGRRSWREPTIASRRDS
jgi:hypothetical protein